MNFYQHHIGDFNNATRHLSRIERSIYRDLLELYYDTENPLTSDFDRLARRCIIDDNDRAAMRDVLNEFFTLEDDGYHNKRADAEIGAYKRMSEGGKRGAEKRWGKGNDSHPIATPLHPQAKANANHEPITKNQEPNKNKTETTPSPDGEVFPKTISSKPQRKNEPSSYYDYRTAMIEVGGLPPELADEFISLRRKKKKEITRTVLRGIQRECEAAGWTFHEAILLVCERGWESFTAKYAEGCTKPVIIDPDAEAKYAAMKKEALERYARDEAAATVPVGQAPKDGWMPRQIVGDSA